jgi:hypothetical protein
LNEVL